MKTLDCKTKMITIDEIILPMRDVNSLNKAKAKTALAANTLLSQEPYSTEEGTQCVIKILDVNDNCDHLNSKEQTKLQKLLQDFES